METPVEKLQRLSYTLSGLQRVSDALLRICDSDARACETRVYDMQPQKSSEAHGESLISDIRDSASPRRCNLHHHFLRISDLNSQQATYIKLGPVYRFTQPT